MELVCGICSKPSSDCEIVDEVTGELLEVLLIDIKTKFGSDPIMCSGCKNELLKCFDFKGKCIYTEDFMYPYIAENESKIDMGTIYSKITGLRLNRIRANPDYFKICRLCIKRVDGQFYNISKDTLRQYKVDEMFFQKFLPEVNLNVTEAPVMCEDCLTSLRRFDRFVSCLSTAKEVSLSNTINGENKGTSTSLSVKPIVCKYCKEKKTNIRRHIESLHNDEADVKEFMLMSDDDPKKLVLLEQIRRDGNFVTFKVDRKIVPARLTAENSHSKEENYIECSESKIILKKDSLQKHLKNSCTKNDSKSVTGVLQPSKANSESIHARANDIVREVLFPAFREGPEKEAIRFDELIISYANDMSSKCKSSNFLVIRNKMIRMAKVLLEIKRLDESVQTFKDIILKPQVLDSLMKVIKSMGAFNEEAGNYEKPTVLTEIVTSLKYIIRSFYSECIKNNNMEEKIVTRTLLCSLLSSLPSRVNKTVVLPSLDDITKLIRYILTQRNKYFKKLNVFFDLDSWINLSNFTLINVLIFNWRGPIELDRSLVSNLDRLKNIGEENYILKQFDSSDQARIREYVRFLIGKGVSVLLDKPMNECLKLILKYRKDAGVLDNNPYLFASPQCRLEGDEKIVFQHLHAISLMKQYSEACGATNPKALRAATLREQITTMSTSLSSNNEEIQHLLGHLRYAEKLDLEYYRQPMSDRDLLTVYKILLAVNGEIPFDSITAPTENKSTEASSRPSAATTISNSIKSTSEYAPSNDVSTDKDLYKAKEISTKPTHKRRRLLAVRPAFSVANKTWTIPERKAVRRIFAHYVMKKNLPTNLEISNAIKNCPVLKNLTISQIKLWIYSGKKSLMSNLNPTDPKIRICKRNVCKYCKEKKSKIGRHIMSLHKDEAEVKEFMLMSDDNPKKRELLAQIRRDGNFEAFKLNRKIVLSSRNRLPNKMDCIACAKCKKILKKNSLRSHLKKYCSKHHSKSARGVLQRSKAVSENIHVRANSIVRKFLFPAFKEGPMKEAIRFDELIILFANELSSKYRSQHNFCMIRHKMIRMAKVLLKIKSFDESVKTFKDILKPQIIDDLMKVINCLGKHNDVTGIYENPTFPAKIGNSLKYITKLFISECIKNNNMEEKWLAENLLHLLRTSLPGLVNKTVSKSLLKKKSEKKVVLPSMDDITKLICYVVKQRNQYFNKLNVNFDLDSWIELSNYTLISALIFNRRRPSELERSLVSNFVSSTSISEESEIFKQLNSSDKAYVREYVRFGIGGGVYVVLDKSMNECLKLLMKYRKEAGVVDNNPYIFALPQDGLECGDKIIFRHVHATHFMKQYSEACGAMNPKTLRKRVTTKALTLNSNNEEIKYQQVFLRHSENIQREYCRQPISEPDDILNVSRILPAAQHDLPVYAISATNIQSTHLLAPTPSATTAISDRNRTSEYVSTNDDFSDEDLYRAEDISPKPTRKRRRLEAVKPSPSAGKRSWTVLEKQATRKLFAQYIAEKKLPSDSEISEAIKNCPELKHRTIPQIRSWIYNCKKTQPEFRAELNLKPEGRTPWNEEQISLVKSHFEENIALKRAPKKDECLKLIEKYPEILYNKDWVRVKTFIYNIYRNK